MISTQEVVLKKLYYILHRAWVDARNAALARDHQKVVDLADTFEILPSLISHWEDGHLDMVRTILTEYQSKYREAAFDYVSILDMDDDHFTEVYASW